jgi:hypothetical protein
MKYKLGLSQVYPAGGGAPGRLSPLPPGLTDLHPDPAARPAGAQSPRAPAPPVD